MTDGLWILLDHAVWRGVATWFTAGVDPALRRARLALADRRGGA